VQQNGFRSNTTSQWKTHAMRRLWLRGLHNAAEPSTIAIHPTAKPCAQFTHQNSSVSVLKTPHNMTTPPGVPHMCHATTRASSEGCPPPQRRGAHLGGRHSDVQARAAKRARARNHRPPMQARGVEVVAARSPHNAARIAALVECFATHRTLCLGPSWQLADRHGVEIQPLVPPRSFRRNAPDQRKPGELGVFLKASMN